MKQLADVLQATIQTVLGVSVPVELTRPDVRFGDFTTNVALRLSQQLGRPPRQVAEAVIAALQDPMIAGAEVAGPGFINIQLHDEVILNMLSISPAQPLAGQVVVAEYSDPNPFKVLHAGHLYTTLVGDAIANLMEQSGGEVHRVNYGGDVGLHVGKCLWAILQNLGGDNPEGLDAVAADSRLEWLSARYVEGSMAYEDDEAAKSAIIDINKRVYQLHTANDHDSAFARIYWRCRQWSYEGFEELYRQLGVAPFEKFYPESEVTDKGLELVKAGLADKVFVESDGAIVFRGEDYGLHTRVFVNSQGLPTYEAKELGLAATKWEDYRFDKSLIITANDIVEYMKVVQTALRNFYPEPTERTVHLTHGMIKLAGGTKMSSRKGNILRAVDVLAAANDANRRLTGQDQPAVALAAVKYAFLKQRLGGDIVYDPDESVALEGNSGPYIQYAHARARSILAKAGLDATPPAAGFQPAERNLLSKLTEYSDVVERAAAEYLPHHICTYLYELAQTFNRFYENNRVIGDDRQSVRLWLVQVYADTLKRGLAILGIQAPDKI